MLVWRNSPTPTHVSPGAAPAAPAIKEGDFKLFFGSERRMDGDWDNSQPRGNTFRHQTGHRLDGDTI